MPFERAAQMLERMLGVQVSEPTVRRGTLRAGALYEVRTVAIGEMAEETSAAGQRELHTCHLSYFSRMTDAESFGDVAQGEMQRRGVSQAKAVCAVTDGADWIQGFVDLHRPDAVRILDFPHAAEHHTSAVGYDSLPVPAGFCDAVAPAFLSPFSQTCAHFSTSCSSCRHLAWLLSSFCLPSLETCSCLSSEDLCKKMTLTPQR
jgi:hypothetical protein